VNLKDITKTIKGSVATLDDLAGGIESIVLTVGFRAATWAATIPTLVLTSRTIGTLFNMRPGPALLSSISLELVGQSVVNQWSVAQEWNESKNKTDAKGRVNLLFGAMCVYFVSDFVFVGILEVPKALTGQWQHFASLIFPLMQVIGTFTMVERASQYRREAAAIAAKEERAANRRSKRSKRRDTGDTNAAKDATPATATLHKRDFDAWLASLNGDRATLTRQDVLAWAEGRCIDVSVATGKSQRDKVSRWCRSQSKN